MAWGIADADCDVAFVAVLLNVPIRRSTASIVRVDAPVFTSAETVDASAVRVLPELSPNQALLPSYAKNIIVEMAKD
eukprot:jgi/Hompol1/1246/HPOL_001762-RA